MTQCWIASTVNQVFRNKTTITVTASSADQFTLGSAARAALRTKSQSFCSKKCSLKAVVSAVELPKALSLMEQLIMKQFIMILCVLHVPCELW